MTTSSASVGSPDPAGARRPLRRPWTGIAADRGYLLLTAIAAAGGLAAIGYLIWTTVSETGPVWDAFGVWGFVTGTEWIPNPPDGLAVFGALPFIWGTFVTSAIAMAIAVPLAVGVALATTVFLPRRLRGPIASVVNLLAAVPSVVYGLWGILVLVPRGPARARVAQRALGEPRRVRGAR